jgi:hypothetical protein
MKSRYSALTAVPHLACQPDNSAGACHPRSMRLPDLGLSPALGCRRDTHHGRDRGHGRHHGHDPGPGPHRGVLRSRNQPGSRDPPRCPCHPSPKCGLRCRRIRYADSPVGLGLEGADVAPQDEEGHVTAGAKIPEGNSLKEWLHPELNDFAVAPRQEFEMKFTVDVPTTADPGTHYGALLVATAPLSRPGAERRCRRRSARLFW